MLRLGIFLLLLTVMSCQKKDEKPLIVRDNAEINYNIYGDGGATLLFVHGAYIDQTYWKAQVDHFKDDYKVVTLDLPGHGKSGKGRKHWSVRGFADDVYTLIKKLQLKNVVLVGHSMGGDVILMEATYRPKNIIGFIGVDNFKSAGQPPTKSELVEIQKIERSLKMDFVNSNRDFARKYLVSDATPKELADRVINDFGNAYHPMADQLFPQLMKLYEDEKELLPELDFKVHLINSDNYPTDENALKRLAKSGYSVKETKATSHYPMVENPAEFNRLLQETLDEIARENDTQKAGY